MLARHGRPPRQVASDGGYARADNIAEAKALGMTDVAFHKRRGVRIETMVEANISCLKRAFGLARCT